MKGVYGAAADSISNGAGPTEIIFNQVKTKSLTKDCLV